MTGQRIEGAVSAMVLIEMPDGSRFGWEIIDPTRLEWEWIGVHPDPGIGTLARLTAEGPFLRKQPTATDAHALAFMEAIKALDPPTKGALNE